MNIIKDHNINSYISSSNSFLIKDIIETPYERVLSIINETIKVLNLASKAQSKLFIDLQWVQKIIKSHLLYSYEIKEKSYVAELSKKNNDFKQFVDFVIKYNEQVIEMNKKNNYITNELLQKPSFQLKRNYNNQKINNNNKRSNSNDINKYQKEKISINCLNKVMRNPSSNKISNNKSGLSINLNDNQIYSNQLMNLNNNSNYIASVFYKNNIRNKFNNKMIRGIFNNCNSFSGIREINNNNRNKNVISLNKLRPINSVVTKYIDKNIENNYLNKINLFLNKNNNLKKINNYQNISIKENDNSNRSECDLLKKYSNIYIDHLLKQFNYDTKKITEKDFNIFELKSIVGQSNVLPLMGKVILETFGLKDEIIINVNKLDTFLNSVSSQYLSTTLYHNNLHGADVTQTICLFFLNSNAEKMFKTTVLDLLSIFIAALGHDIGHPGLTNNFHINASTELAITYNDASCLENFHCCKLFLTLKKDESNIFEKLSVNDYKNIRKRMISEILATDMFNHKKIITFIQSKLSQIKDGKFEFISNDKESIIQEQQCLLDFFIHTADLAHNTKAFSISLKWVELLSEEFWLQGDKEKSMGLTVSFLCDRNTANVPSSQVNFIRGFILPTFEILINIFPTLNYTVENANNNINEWQKLVDAHRTKGWTPRKNNNRENNFKEKKDKNECIKNEIMLKKNKSYFNNNNKEKNLIIRANLSELKTENFSLK
jgi:hypothetical protein